MKPLSILLGIVLVPLLILILSAAAWVVNNVPIWLLILGVGAVTLLVWGCVVLIKKMKR
jgi:hypothetical protein